MEIRDLVVRFGTLAAVDGVTLSAEAGAVTAVIGPNGAGKTTTVETAEGYRRPSGGTVRVLGLDPVSDHVALVPRIGVMLQKSGVYPAMSPRVALRLFAAYYQRPEDPDGLLDRLGLAPVAATPWRRLSGGEQQRLSLALALVGRPEVAFLDEPTAGVDPEGRRTIRALIRELRDNGVAVVVTTHDLHEAEPMADHVVIVDHGKVVADGTPDSLRAEGDTGEVRFAAVPGLDVVALAARLGVPVVEDRPGEYLVGPPVAPRMLAALTAWMAEHDHSIADLRTGRPSLEDVFLRLVGGDG